MPKGTSSIPTLEPSITTSGAAVALKLVSFVVAAVVVRVTVINVLEVMFSLGLRLVESNGSVAVVAVVERKLDVVLAVFTAMVGCRFLKQIFSNFFPLFWCGC